MAIQWGRWGDKRKILREEMAASLIWYKHQMSVDNSSGGWSL